MALFAVRFFPFPLYDLIDIRLRGVQNQGAVAFTRQARTDTRPYLDGLLFRGSLIQQLPGLRAIALDDLLLQIRNRTMF